MALTLGFGVRSLVAISDFCDRHPIEGHGWTDKDYARAWAAAGDPTPPAQREAVRVTGGYLERLPLAAVAAGLADRAEVWSFRGHDEGQGADTLPALRDLGAPRLAERVCPGLIRRAFRADPGPGGPHRSADMRAHIARFGAPDILCVWGLGVDEAILNACAGSVRIYNSIDALAIRIPPEVSRHFDIFLTGAEWQSDEIRARHPQARCAVLPIGPEFASDITFHPTGASKDYDIVYVAATQPYKRHDLLLDALAAMPRDIRALCVAGYGHLTDALREDAERRGLSVDWMGPVSHDAVNGLINRAKVGVVCGVEDGAPAILTEYMLAGLPVVANAGLVCGRQYIRPDTGLLATEAEFPQALMQVISRHQSYHPRKIVQDNWTWPHGIARLGALIDEVREHPRLERAAAAG